MWKNLFCISATGTSCKASKYPEGNWPSSHSVTKHSISTSGKELVSGKDSVLVLNTEYDRIDNSRILDILGIREDNNQVYGQRARKYGKRNFKYDFTHSCTFWYLKHPKKCSPILINGINLFLQHCKTRSLENNIDS